MRKLKLLILSILLSVFCRSFGQTIVAPRLECIHDSTSNGDIILYWSNPPVSPCGTFVQYTIYASANGPNGPYNAIAVNNQAATTYTLVNYLSQSQTWYFYMEAAYSNCAGATVQQSDTINNLSPSTPVIVNVTVTPGGQVIFNWLPGTSPQTTNYEIYHAYPTANPQQFATVHGRLNTTYVDNMDNPDTKSLGYTVAAVDSCGEVSSFNTLPQYTIYMQAAIVDCQQQININWNKYINWPKGVEEYEILVSRNDSAFRVAGTTDSSTLTYQYTEFNTGDSLCFVVRAISAADTSVISNSNQVCIKAFIVQAPSFIYITNVTVDTFNHVLVTWDVDTLGQLVSYNMLQSTDDENFSVIDQLGIPSPFLSFETYDDSSASPQTNPYYYQVVAFDSCQNTYPSNVGVSISLQGQLYDYYVVSLNWNEFQLLDSKVLYYNLYRNIGDVNGYVLDKTFPDLTTQTLDTVSKFLNVPGIFCYEIEAVYYIDLPNGFHDTLTSWSNRECVIHRPVVYVPNAFAPNGLNNVFKPTIIYGNPQGYSLIIYNRWGGEIFVSHDPSEGWDGMDHGKEGTEGGYAYLIEFTADDGVVTKQSGIVLLIR